ncbi:ABC transporter ATP-binding protein, partial [Streptomyces cinereoruber]
MTDTTLTKPPTTAPDEPDPFDRDDLPAPPGATGALLRSLLSAHRARVAVAALVLLVKEAAVQAGP